MLRYLKNYSDQRSYSLIRVPRYNQENNGLDPLVRFSITCYIYETGRETCRWRQGEAISCL
jgi:hypothetical protein